MTRIPVIAMILLVTLTACNLSAAEQDSQSDAAQATEAPSATPAPTSTAPPTNTGVPQPTITIVPQVNNCTPRTDWPLYTVRAGDTVSSIARRTNSTVRAISAANCLADASVIQLGQELRVPDLPAAESQGTGYISVNPYEAIEADVYVLGLNKSVILSWVNAPAGLSAVRFYAIKEGTDDQILARDDNPGDGVSSVFVVPVGLDGSIVAIGLNANGNEVARSTPLPVRADEMDGIVGDILVSPFLMSTENGYILAEGRTVQLSWSAVGDSGPLDYNGIQAEFVYTPEGSNQPISIGIDSDPSDGYTANWVVPVGADGTVLASARLPGESHNSIRSIIRYVESRSTNAIGRVSFKPVLRTEGGWVYARAGETVILTWVEMPPSILAQLEQVAFYLAPTGTGIDLADLDPIGVDTNMSDGINYNWTIPAESSGHLAAIGTTKDGGRIDTATLLNFVSESGD